MRILHLVSYAVLSGPVAGVLGLARAQRALGHEAWVAYDRLRGPFSPYEEPILPAHLAPSEASDADLRPPLALAVSPKAAPWHLVADVLRLRRFVRGGGADVVHTHLSHDHFLLAACGALPAARVRSVHAPRSLRPRLGQGWLWRRTDGVVLRASGHGQLLEPVGLARQVPRALVPGAVDAGFWRPPSRDERGERAATRAALGLAATGPLLLHVALMAGRGQRELLQALEEHARRGTLGALQVALVGRGPEEAPLRQLAQSPALAGRVHLLGYLEAPALRRLYRAADAAFLAQAGNDASARAALEAMASALPVLAVQEGALRELLDEVVGYPVADRSPATVAAALGAWLQDLARGQARGRAARRRILRQRTFAQEAEATLALYDRALARVRLHGGLAERPTLG